MRNRQPAEQRLPTVISRAAAIAPRSPAERLEPTRPPSPPRRRRRHEGEGPRRGSPLVRVVNGLLTFVLLFMLLVGGLAFLFDSQIDAPGPLDRTKVVVIPKGEGTHEIAARLEREGAIADRRLFVAGYLWTKLAAWLEGGRPVQLRAGDYAVKENASIRQIIELLSEGRAVAHKVTIPEGLTSYQIVERLKADPNLTGEIGSEPAEGTLLPDTFMIERGTPRQVIIERMQADQRRLLEKAWAQRRKDLPLKSMEEALILASIVEKETGRSDERERVAAVFINRLRQNMRLQSDPTILYGLSGGKTVWSRPIQRSEIAQKTSHNTYQIDGLPPTPICNPGRAAIEAVLNPADTKDLYFVADGTGGHVFAETLKDHNANVLKWRAVEKDLRAKAAAGAAAPQADAPAPAAEPAKRPSTRAVVRSVPAKKAPGAEKGNEATPAAKAEAAPAKGEPAQAKGEPPAKGEAAPAKGESPAKSKAAGRAAPEELPWLAKPAKK